ncbi:phospholipid-transporting ATPase ID-like isoform X2 [Ostrea edulis]|uniref:phospholipid-transporting ATPase ID-like isoform X2 n=1 Tax=Ostrea edulis TaxID=37623 RepID=UPI0024AE9614|nr:phospholipid-transporting ATPase ID-like isoform X2 [Ostrea edulis]XP_056022668.1 phospholipid-transporting ATPase ID-like isoform X2 [Ostrea edulis]XP_056022669.1 phospholipid-transporting ATPase ID-like isoform X2 [Ostrea edulis]
MQFWKKEKPIEIERHIKGSDPAYNTQFLYANNYICTSKYSIISFLPKNIFEQFRRIANFYFLCLLILQVIPAISSLPWYTTAVPLVSVLGISAIKDLIDDVQRHRNDALVNNRKSWVLREGKLVEERWHKVVVGDIIKMENNQFVAADLLLLSTSEPHSLCYIETAELDGETNLKVKQALPDTAELGDDITQLSKFDAVIQCEAPNNNLSKFEGNLTWRGQKYSLDNEKMLLRGCVLRNTQWCYGLVIFAGKDTKLMMNSGKTVFKRTHIDRLMNLIIIGIFILLLVMCLTMTVSVGIWETLVGTKFTVYLPWESFVPGSAGKSGNVTEGATTIALLIFFSYIIIFNTVVPISLYVSVEMIRLANSFLINWDNKMYYEKTNTPAKARTTTLNEELGQIEYIFTDKTGTLTQNIMTFNKCSIDGKSYGDVVDEYGNPMDITEQTVKVDLADNPFAEESFEFFDQRLLDAVHSNKPLVHEFFKILALCHTVMPEIKDGVLEYQAQSPDEGALVSAARNFGFVFKSRTPNTITIDVNGKEEVFDLLCILDFNNVRKRMSVIVRKNGKIQLLCKGADNVIFERLDESCVDAQEIVTHHLNEFANDGLRTLCLASKDISESYWNTWKAKHHEASVSMNNRDENLANVYEEIEQNLILVGATAIEDKLQDGVPDTIANLAAAGIKIWVLTGDKQETAINIGYSCRLLTDEMEDVFIVDGETQEEVKKQMTEYLQAIKDHKMERQNEENVQMSNGGVSFNGSAAELNVDMPGLDFALVINGHSLYHALRPDQENLLVELGCSCKAIICCRVTPLQKALVVDLIKKSKNSVTLSIGDGANDVSMIKTAHIGVGISGQEGMQAVLASDYSVAQFRYLERLLLVHGRWSYFRMCKFLKYFFYKNFAFTLCHLWFAFFCGFSAQSLYDPYFVSFYNVFYTSMPVLILACFDQDVNDYYSIRYPKLYTPGLLDSMFNKKMFAFSAGEGIFTSIVLFFIPYFAFKYGVHYDGTDLSDHQSLGCAVASTLVVAVNLRCALDMSYWTAFHHVAIWGSIIYYFCFIIAMYASSFNYTYEGVAYQVFSSAQFWFTLLLTCTILLVPVIAYRYYNLDVHPTLTDRIRLKQRLTKSKSRSKDLHLRRASTLRRSTRSLRSGYAFAHQEGFGELITSGLNMRSRAEKSEQKAVELTKVKKIENPPLPNYDDLYKDNRNSNGALNTVSNENSSATVIVENPTHYHDPDKHVMFCEKL